MGSGRTLALEFFAWRSRGEKLAARFGAQIFNYCFGARVDVQFFVNCPDVTAHGINADLHAVGDFFVGVTVRQLVQKLALAGRESGQRWNLPGSWSGR